MTPFLKCVATAYTSDPEARELLPDTWFVFPNKRAGTFFLKHMRDISGGLGFAPMVTTITDLVTEMSGRTVNTRIDSIFLLHKCYRETIGPRLSPETREELTSFDSFRRWGETILRDFNEVDMHMADAEALFKNLYDFKVISTPFLTEEQRAVMEEYFGYKPAGYDTDRFWQKFGLRLTEDSPEASIADTEADVVKPTQKFIQLWRALAPLYTAFHKALADQGLTTSGGAYRLAVERLRQAIDEGHDAVSRLVGCRKIVFIGFNALSMAERNLFLELKSLEIPGTDRQPMADFIWDATGPVLNDRRNSAGRFIALNQRDFPAPEWLRDYLKPSRTNSLPELLQSVSSPSNVMQVKIAMNRLSELHSKIGDEPFDNARVAMVLPDENLLLPLLYSMPPAMKDANLTMGYPLRLTAVTSFIDLLRRMQLARRDSMAYEGFSFEEFKNLLGHPYSHMIIGSRRIMDFIDQFEKHHISVVKDSDFKKLGSAAETIFSPLPQDASPGKVIDYLIKVLELIDKVLRNKAVKKESKDNGSLELTHVGEWIDALKRLDDTIEEYGVKLSVAGTLGEAYRLLQGEVVPFNGEPLKGLQVMGMLETRALDFDYILIVSANDHIIPKRSRQRSFLPNVLRRGYGLPPINYVESLFAYYFYRMISRAKSATFIYDNRDSSLAGGPSRYIEQLEHIYARGHVKHIEYKFDLKSREATPHVIEKTPDVMETLEKFRNKGIAGDRRFNLSASTLRHYIQCPLKFYLTSVVGLKDDPEVIDTVDAITYGNIIHSVMERILLADRGTSGIWLDPPIQITREYLQGILDDTRSLQNLIRHEINRLHYKLDKLGESLDRKLEEDTGTVAETALEHITAIIKSDMKAAPFNLYGCEIRSELDYPMADGKSANMTYAIDRVDDAGCMNPYEVRVVDYKTGTPHIEAESMDSVFSSDYRAANILQLMLYSMFLNMRRVEEGKHPLTIHPVIYDVPRIHLDKKKKEIPRISGQPVVVEPTENGQYGTADGADGPENNGTVSVMEAFRSRFDSLLEEIFSDMPFKGDPKPDRCRFCIFQSLCN